MGTNLREPPLRRILEAVEDCARDRELEDAIPQKLEPLVRLGAVLRPGRVREDLLAPFLRQLGDQTPEIRRSRRIVRQALASRATPGVR